MQKNNVISFNLPQEPKKKKSKANRREKTDDFDAMVTKYRNKILASSKKTGMKWFGD